MANTDRRIDLACLIVLLAILGGLVYAVAGCQLSLHYHAPSATPIESLVDIDGDEAPSSSLDVEHSLEVTGGEL